MLVGQRKGGADCRCGAGNKGAGKPCGCGTAGSCCGKGCCGQAKGPSCAGASCGTQMFGVAALICLLALAAIFLFGNKPSSSDGVQGKGDPASSERVAPEAKAEVRPAAAK